MTRCEAWQVFGAVMPNKRRFRMDYMNEAQRHVQRYEAEKQRMKEEEKLKVKQHFQLAEDGSDWLPVELGDTTSKEGD